MSWDRAAGNIASAVGFATLALEEGAMDAGQFDDIVRSLTAESTRRRLARALTGIGLGSVLGSLLGPPVSEAKKKRKKKKKKCKGSTKKCGKKCIPVDDCCTSAECPAGSHNVCRGGDCVCADGDEECDGVCVSGDCCATPDCPHSGQICDDHTCVCQFACCADDDCGQHMVCSGHTCVCDTGFHICAGRCTAICGPSEVTLPAPDCGCCTGNEVACSAPGDCCSGICNSNVCQGKVAGQPCTFGVECAGSQGFPPHGDCVNNQCVFI